MRQAIVIQNPKWEPFNTASDAFKAAKAPAVLVVRGRSKEKKVSKIASVKKVASTLAVLLFCFAANAQENITAKAGGATLTGSSTNTSAANGFIGWNIDQVGVFQLTCVGTNAATTNAVVVKMDVSDNGTDWVANQHSITATPGGTTAGTSITRITNSVGGKYLRVNRTENPNAAAVTMGLTVSLR